MCGDTRPSAGEDAVCENIEEVEDLPTSPYQFATWNSELALELDKEDANICVGSQEGCLFKLISQTFITEARTKINAVVEEDDSRTTGSSDLIYRSNVCKMPEISLNSSIPFNGQQEVCRNPLIYITLDGVNADDSFEINLTDNTTGEQNIIFASDKAGNEICSAVLPADGIVWGLNENIGNKAHDRNGGEEATIYAGVWTDGKYSSAIDFNGTSTYLYSYNSSFDISSFNNEGVYNRAKWSVGMWVNPRNLASDTHRTLFSAYH